MSRAVLEPNITQIPTTQATVYEGAENIPPRRHDHRRGPDRASTESA